MAGNILTKGEGLPGYMKGIIFIGGGAVIVVAGVKIYKGIKKRVDMADSIKEEKDVKNELKNLEDKGVKPTMSNDQYTSKANQIFTAMDGYGTDNETIHSIFGTMKNDADILKLIGAFGVKTISSGKFNVVEPDFTGTLPSAMVFEMPQVHRDVLNASLRKKGIKYTF